jgi:hypothetical protein
MDTLKTRLGQYGAAWVGSFLLVLVLSLFATVVLGMEMTAVADGLLIATLAALSFALLAGVVLTVIGRDSTGIKIVVVLLALVLGLPLLWAPVLAVVLAAGVNHTPIEYSEVYAWFRITVSQILYPLVSSIVSGAAIRWVWEMFQIFATIVGGIASAIQVWNFLKKMFVPPAPVEA